MAGPSIVKPSPCCHATLTHPATCKIADITRSSNCRPTRQHCIGCRWGTAGCPNERFLEVPPPFSLFPWTTVVPASGGVAGCWHNRPLIARNRALVSSTYKTSQPKLVDLRNSCGIILIANKNGVFPIIRRWRKPQTLTQSKLAISGTFSLGLRCGT